MNDGDWICSDANCGNINFARRVSCYRCNKEKPDAAKKSNKKLGTEIGKSAAEKSRGLFNADDWQCNKCANVNWARRTTCNVCNAPKFGEVEARTGYGGGYNERGVVEYRRRDSSSDDEYDEFGRKKRNKRKSESHHSDSFDKVGTTEGPVYKKLPLMLQKGSMLEQASASNKREKEKISGSLSDGSVCDQPPLSITAFRRYQIQNQTSYHRQDNMLPNYQTGFQSRKRYSSMGDKDHNGSSGYETGSKKCKRDSTESPISTKAYNPVMENMVTSTNNDVLYKFTGPSKAETFEVTYTLEERVKVAAFAIVYSNCKLSTQKFESLYDKPAPDFKTIFAWRQRLLLTGCLVDAHTDARTDNAKPHTKISSINELQKKPVQKLPNPDEILISISSDSESECDNDKISQNYPQVARPRSASVETMVISGIENNIRPTGSSASTADERTSRGRSRSRSTQHKDHSSQVSQESDYPDTDSEQNKKTKCSRNSAKSNQPVRHSVSDTDSDSISYNSDEEDFLSRVYKSKKPKRKIKRCSNSVTTVTPAKATTYDPPILPTFPGYNTVKPSEKSALVTGNIYASNLRNMAVKSREYPLVDTDGCSSEYIPTKVGSNAKKNYQAFRDNVKKKGYWAKANGQSITNKPRPRNNVRMQNVENKMQDSFWSKTNKQCMNMNNDSTAHVIPGVQENESENFWVKSNGSMISTKPRLSRDSVTNQPSIDLYGAEPRGYVTAQQPITINNDNEYANDDFNFVQVDLYKSSEKVSVPGLEQSPENTSCVFDMVQSNSVNKSKSIMDIFNNEENADEISEGQNDLEKYDSARKLFETEWDDEDDDLYKTSDPAEISLSTRRTPSPPNIGSITAQDSLKNIDLPDEISEEQTSTPNKISMEVIRDRRDKLLDILKDFQDNRENEINSNISIPTPDAKKLPIKPQVPSNIHKHAMPTSLTVTPKDMPAEISNEILLSGQDKQRTNKSLSKTSPSKRVHIIKSVTIKPNDSLYIEQNLYRHSDDSSSTPVTNNTTSNFGLQESITTEVENSIQTTQVSAPQIDLSNILSGLNTNTLLLALQSIQQISQSSSSDNTNKVVNENTEQNITNENQPVETINLTNDEDWEKESNADNSIERQLERLDGNTGDTPFLSDIFDPAPVVVPPQISKKLSINLKKPVDKTEAQPPLDDENIPVIGNFKSFALPKPILLNRLKLTVKVPDKSSKSGAKKNKSKASASKGEGGEEEEDDDEESGDEADLSKYDLWGSDNEQGSSKTDGEKAKEGESSKEVSDPGDKNGKRPSPEAKRSKRSRSSSSSSSSSTSSSSSSQTSAPKNKFDDFNLNSEREGSPRARKSRSRSRSPGAGARSGGRRKSRDSRSAGETRNSRDKEYARDRERRDKSRGERKERRYSRDGNHYGGRGRHR